MINIDVKEYKQTQTISDESFREDPSCCSRLADRVRYCLRVGSFAIGGGICGMASVFAYEWSRTSGSLSDSTPIWITLGGVVGASYGNCLKLIWSVIPQREYHC